MTSAIILAAGMGTRLRPLTDDRPKCLVELLGRPLLDHQIDVLHSAGISDIHVVGGYMVEKLYRKDITVHVSKRFESTNMVHTLFCAEAALRGEEDIVVSYGDIVYQPRVLRSLLECPSEICVVSDRKWLKYWRARFSNPLDDAETFTLDDEGRISSLGKKPNTADEVVGQFIGLLKFRGDGLQRLKSTWLDLSNTLGRQVVEMMYTTDFLSHLIDQHWELRPVFIRNGWAEIDSPSDLLVAPTFYHPGSIG